MAVNANGIWIYTEADLASLYSDLLNLGMNAVSDQFTADRNRLTALEAKALNAAPSLVTADTTGVADATERLIPSQSVTIAAVAGATYRLMWHGRALSSVAADRLGVKIRRTSLTGTIVQDAIYMPASAGVAGSFTVLGFDTPGPGSVTWVATFARAGGTGTARIVATATAPALLTVERWS